MAGQVRACWHAGGGAWLSCTHRPEQRAQQGGGCCVAQGASCSPRLLQVPLRPPPRVRAVCAEQGGQQRRRRRRQRAGRRIGSGRRRSISGSASGSPHAYARRGPASPAVWRGFAIRGRVAAPAAADARHGAAQQQRRQRERQRRPARIFLRGILGRQSRGLWQQGCGRAPACILYCSARVCGNHVTLVCATIMISLCLAAWLYQLLACVTGQRNRQSLILEMSERMRSCRRVVLPKKLLSVVTSKATGEQKAQAVRTLASAVTRKRAGCCSHLMRIR